jgi:hypothetical protein
MHSESAGIFLKKIRLLQSIIISLPIQTTIVQAGMTDKNQVSGLGKAEADIPTLKCGNKTGHQKAYMRN